MASFQAYQLQQKLRELLMRGKLAFPENEQDSAWWDEGLKPEHFVDFMEWAGLGKDKNPLENY